MLYVSIEYPQYHQNEAAEDAKALEAFRSNPPAFLLVPVKEPKSK